jgi:hypothetical protein
MTGETKLLSVICRRRSHDLMFVRIEDQYERQSVELLQDLVIVRPDDYFDRPEPRRAPSKTAPCCDRDEVRVLRSRSPIQPPDPRLAAVREVEAANLVEAE